MTVLDLVIAPDPRLSICSKEVEKVTDATRKFMDDMLETMYHYEGIGLAAVQVGVHDRILVMDIPDDDSPPYFIINPKIINSSSEQKIYEEGCLSFPDQHAKVMRPTEVEVEYLDYNGEKKRMKCSGLTATCIQHELDHLNGVVFIDHVSKLKHDMIMKRMQKMKKLYSEQ